MLTNLLNRKRLITVTLVFLGPILAALLLDQLFPLDLSRVQAPERFASVVTDRNGRPLRSFADAQGVWRYRVGLEDVSPLYLEALLGYEDRWFHQHPGVNPVSLLRALWQCLRAGEVVSGGSTLTMQVARLLGTDSSTPAGKLRQILRALQLEWRLSKADILQLYCNLAPFGGPLEGVQAASYAYFGRPAARLTRAQAALLAVLPQAPSRYRPDRHPRKARQTRDKVLKRLARFGIWPEEVVQDARLESVIPVFDPHPVLAPLLCKRLVLARPNQAVIASCIDANLQQHLEQRVRAYVQSFSEKTSAAVLVMDNRGLQVRASIGTADFGSSRRCGYIDMTRALRSPGSTLKPFVYGLAMDRGLIHAQSLLFDVPMSFQGYRPANFSEGFSGPVSMARALQRSLNIPAVQVLDRLSPRSFFATLEHAGLDLRLPPQAGPNLSLALGGLGTNLESLVGLFAALARDGLAGRPRLSPGQALRQRRILSPGTAWVLFRILADARRPDRPARSLLAYSGDLAWKTGTSFGFRDSWAIGVSSGYTVGVWVGRPDGTPSPGRYGAVTAAPLLFSIAECLPKTGPPLNRPESVSKETICWPLGTLAADQDESFCHVRREAWIVDNQVPPTFQEPDERWQSNPIRFFINPETGRRVDSDCPQAPRQPAAAALWPKRLEPWIEARFTRSRLIPPPDEGCLQPPRIAPQSLKIIGLRDQSIIRAARADPEACPTIQLEAVGGIGRRYWFVDGRPITPKGVLGPEAYRFQTPGRHQLAVVDAQGNTDRLSLDIRPWGEMSARVGQ